MKYCRDKAKRQPRKKYEKKDTVKPRSDEPDNADIQIVEKREEPLLRSRATESEDHAIWHMKKQMFCMSA